MGKGWVGSVSTGGIQENMQRMVKQPGVADCRKYQQKQLSETTSCKHLGQECPIRRERATTLTRCQTLIRKILLRKRKENSVKMFHYDLKIKA